MATDARNFPGHQIDDTEHTQQLKCLQSLGATQGAVTLLNWSAAKQPTHSVFDFLQRRVRTSSAKWGMHPGRHLVARICNCQQPCGRMCPASSTVVLPGRCYQTHVPEDLDAGSLWSTLVNGRPTCVTTKQMIAATRVRQWLGSPAQTPNRRRPYSACVAGSTASPARSSPSHTGHAHHSVPLEWPQLQLHLPQGRRSARHSQTTRMQQSCTAAPALASMTKTPSRATWAPPRAAAGNHAS